MLRCEERDEPHAARGDQSIDDADATGVDAGVIGNQTDELSAGRGRHVGEGRQDAGTDGDRTGLLDDECQRQQRVKGYQGRRSRRGDRGEGIEDAVPSTTSDGTGIAFSPSDSNHEMHMSRTPLADSISADKKLDELYELI